MIYIRHFYDLIDYNTCYQGMINAVESIKSNQYNSNSNNYFIDILRHHHIYTAGTGFKDSHLKDKNLDFCNVNRGGSITYHGPDQVVVYFMIDIKFFNIFVRDFIFTLEQFIIDALQHYKIAGYRVPGSPGIWANGKKIGFVGIRVSRNIAYHGLSINMHNTHKYDNFIYPCGLDCEITSIQQEIQQDIKKKNTLSTSSNRRCDAEVIYSVLDALLIEFFHSQSTILVFR